eukprot:3004806-Amphidinium_carterae.1
MWDCGQYPEADYEVLLQGLPMDAELVNGCKAHIVEVLRRVGHHIVIVIHILDIRPCPFTICILAFPSPRRSDPLSRLQGQLWQLLGPSPLSLQNKGLSGTPPAPTTVKQSP